MSDWLIGVATVVFIVVSAWFFTHWLGSDLFYSITAGVSILALSWEVARLRKILRENGIDPSPRRKKGGGASKG